jgi:hypothetical protein
MVFCCVVYSVVPSDKIMEGVAGTQSYIVDVQTGQYQVHCNPVSQSYVVYSEWLHVNLGHMGFFAMARFRLWESSLMYTHVSTQWIPVPVGNVDSRGPLMKRPGKYDKGRTIRKAA